MEARDALPPLCIPDGIGQVPRKGFIASREKVTLGPNPLLSFKKQESLCNDLYRNELEFVMTNA